MPIEGEGLVDPDVGVDQQQDQERSVTYVLHPNCAIEEM